MIKLSRVINILILLISLSVFCFAADIKEPNVAGAFYPADKDTLSRQIDGYFALAEPEAVNGDIFCVICPHAGYEFSGQVAAYSYKLIKDKPYKVAIVLAPSHYYPLNGVSVYASGVFRTPLGDLQIDEDFTSKLTGKYENIVFQPLAFQKEHSLEVQLPFLQKSLADFKIVPIIVGQCDFQTLQNLSALLVSAIGSRKDVLLVASSDFYHGYDWQEAEAVDNLSISSLEKMSAQDTYDKLTGGAIQMCGGLPVVTAMLTSEVLGHKKIKILKHTNSANVTGRKTKGDWTVGYVSAVIDQEKSEVDMLNDNQKKRLLEIARKTIEEYLTTSKVPEFKEDDPRLKEVCGAFVTLHKHGDLRGCIGNIIGQEPLYLTVRNMAIESATGDPRFPKVTKDELKDIEIEISALSPLKKIKDISEFELGVHGVIVRQGWHQGVFLPQVATETGWTKEEFLSNLCAQKAGLPADAWKLEAAEKFIFSAIVFSEREFP